MHDLEKQLNHSGQQECGGRGGEGGGGDLP